MSNEIQNLTHGVDYFRPYIEYVNRCGILYNQPQITCPVLSNRPL